MSSDFVHKFATFSIPDPRLPPRDDEVVDFLRTCADRWWDKDILTQHQNANSYYPFNARSLVNIVMKSSVAADDPASERIMRFVERFNYHAALDWSALDTKRKTDILYEHFGRLDELFFFGLITGEVDGLSGRAPLVLLETDPDRYSDKLGAFKPTTAKIVIWLRDYDFEQLFLTLAHEMTHGFLSIFSDTRHKSHYEWVDQSSGHGKMFWMLLRFLINSIFTFTKSNYFWSQILVSEDEHYDCVIEQHGPSRPRFV
ncbi:hypothetical protein NUW58_g9408 [Xylaria curta]|uniref:Uncharacterized protein n=1 Tax=Xylaria curta TaxID=42375 RepID=A0ACC1MXU8_9PEZI|nr:hypothetical protein NUW58_g9408 [Xylaria curta]